ncbi:endo-1,4-beta-xylanase [Amphibacillus indicireducens]|uniref:Beta-xylanase n=1 Tax=Amphibacillus indicireducens TaxID=1076330 RepID=A0ABP7VBH7_9BACI
MRKLTRLVVLMLVAVLIFPSKLVTPLLVVDAESETTIFHETFDSEEMVFLQSGGASLSYLSGLDFTENGHGLYVDRRMNDYDAADLAFAQLGLEDRHTYSVTVAGYVDVDEDVPAGAEIVLSLVDSYTWINNLEINAGEQFELTAEFTVDLLMDEKIRIQSNENGKNVSFYVTEVVIEEVGAPAAEASVEEERKPAKQLETITFEDGELHGFEARGGNELLTVTDEANYTPGGSSALKVESRQQDWNGPSLRIEQFIDKGSEYHLSVWVKLIDPGSAEITLSSQIGSGDFGASYNNIQTKTVSVDDNWIKLEGTYRYSSVGDEYVTLYIESSSPNASFYIDDVSLIKTNTDLLEIQRNLTSISEVYKDYFMIGNAVSTSDFAGDRLTLLKGHHNLVTAENAMKPDSAYNNRHFDFNAEDMFVQMALDEGLAVHGHVLVWHQQSPEWLWADDAGESLAREDALVNLRTHIETTVAHFGDSVISWDVVNEAMNDNPPNPEDWQGSLRQSGWLQAIGPDYIEESFRIAKDVIDQNGWDIKLYYNDYNDDNQQKAEAIYQMVKEINENYAAENDGELLIDGIGMQGHYNINTNPENVRLSLEKFASLGVEVGVTELDVTSGSDGEQTEEELNQQAYLYARLFQIYRDNHEHISRITFWGLDDGSSWRSDQSPLLFDRNMQAKPAYYAVINPDEFLADFEVIEADARLGKAAYGTPEIDGKIDDIWGEAPVLPIDRYQGAWHGASGEARVLWDEENLYVLVEVNDSELDKTAEDDDQHDSVEVFIEESKQKSTFYQDGDGQYRVNFDNEASFSPEGISEGFESATTIDGTNYLVEMKIPFTTITPEANSEIGFDIQINDAVNGSRESVAIWNDLSGMGFQDPSVFGNLTLATSVDQSELTPIETGSSGSTTLIVSLIIAAIVITAGGLTLYHKKRRNQ